MTGITDPCVGFSGDMASPCTHAFVITPDDDNDLSTMPRGIYIGSAGDVNAIAADDTDPVLFPLLQPGSVLPIRVRRVLEAGTTVRVLVGIY